MANEIKQYAVEYVARRTGKPWEAKIYTHDREAAEIRRGTDLTYSLMAKGGDSWALDPKVHGEVRPFSLIVRRNGKREGIRGKEEPVLTIREHLFRHNNRFYMLTNSPEGRPLRELLLGKRYICRLDNFPFNQLESLDHETKSKLRRFRGVPVGEIDGLGTEGHRVKLSPELEDIGLPLAACCYLLYSTA